MSLAIDMDVHVPAGVSQGLRRKQIDVHTAQDDSAGRTSDDELLMRATAIGRVLLTQDADFFEIAAQWQW
jgi:predicted nuclease of predicted toxin-antitoxin system